MARFRVPVAAPCPAEIVFPPEPKGKWNEQQTLLAAWSATRQNWHRAHQVGGQSELGTSVDLQRATHAARILYLAARGGLDNGGDCPYPPCWRARWDERPEWLRDLPP